MWNAHFSEYKWETAPYRHKFQIPSATNAFYPLPASDATLQMSHNLNNWMLKPSQYLREPSKCEERT